MPLCGKVQYNQRAITERAGGGQRYFEVLRRYFKALEKNFKALILKAIAVLVTMKH
jgi:hypothetical protein